MDDGLYMKGRFQSEVLLLYVLSKFKRMAFFFTVKKKKKVNIFYLPNNKGKPTSPTTPKVSSFSSSRAGCKKFDLCQNTSWRLSRAVFKVL